ncbi:MAG: PAC2 family protein, partial [Dehalococcoidales bacterium]|nr:PAC2 family protein [Dehalococcoidales bacterium]
MIDYLCHKLPAGMINNLEPSDFFTLHGVKVKSDLVEFPEANFYMDEKSNLVLFLGDVPEFRWFQFFNRVFDISEEYIPIQQCIIIGGISTFLYHTEGRNLIGVYNSQEMKKSMNSSGLASEFDYETPPDQKPSINSFFIWTASKRQISGACIFATVPFYLADLDD